MAFALGAGTKLEPYEFIAPLGAGGMGEVYRARDTRLDREVAIKVLPEAMARDKERAVRFEREAKLLATLNHPKIAGIYRFEEGMRGTLDLFRRVGESRATPFPSPERSRRHAGRKPVDV